MIAKSIKEAYNKMGFKGILKYYAQRLVDVEKLEDQINTANYILKHYCDIKQFPKAEGDLRNLQIADALLLAIVDVILKKNSFSYWVDAGTCLGAVRHNGFVPWDDDMDICMMRDEYEKAKHILSKELGVYGIEAAEDSSRPIGRFGIGYKHQETGVWVDLIPAEYTTIDANDSVLVNDYKERCYKYQRLWEKRRKRMTRAEAFRLRKKILPEICEKENAKSISYGPEEGLHPRLWSIEDILPNKEIEFEGYKVLAPSNTHSYLVQYYGDYMNFPKAGVEHHGGKRGILSTWAKESGTDMNNIIHELYNILEKMHS